VQFRSAHHSSPTDAARVFERAKPRPAVLHACGARAGPTGEGAERQDVLGEVAQVFTGRVEVGEDLMRIVVGDTVEVHRREPR
jgi:ribonuclease Z